MIAREQQNKFNFKYYHLTPIKTNYGQTTNEQQTKTSTSVNKSPNHIMSIIDESFFEERCRQIINHKTQSDGDWSFHPIYAHS